MDASGVVVILPSFVTMICSEWRVAIVIGYEVVNLWRVSTTGMSGCERRSGRG